MRPTDKVQDSPSSQRRPVAHFDGSDDEPRDEGGKWTSGGSAGPGAAKAAVRGHAKSQALGSDAEHKGREASGFSQHATAASAKAGSNPADHAAAKMANVRAAAAHDSAAVAFDEAGKHGDAAAHRDMAAGHAAMAARHESAAQMLTATRGEPERASIAAKSHEGFTRSAPTAEQLNEPAPGSNKGAHISTHTNSEGAKSYIVHDPVRQTSTPHGNLKDAKEHLKGAKSREAASKSQALKGGGVAKEKIGPMLKQDK